MKTFVFLAAALLVTQTALAQGRGGRGGGGAAPQTPKVAAPIDITGYWVSVVTEDWRYRISPWQGVSTAQWQLAGGRRGGAANGGGLKVLTTKMKAGYLQKNGVPYSENAVLTEYFELTKEANGDQWLIDVA